MLVDRKLALLAAFFALSSNAHPACKDNTGPTEERRSEMKFCTEIIDPSNPYGGCCTYQDELNQKAKLYDKYTLSPACQPYQRQVACGYCHPFSTHLLTRGGDIFSMTDEFCNDYYAACKADVGLPDNFCATYVNGEFYSYPLDSDMGKINAVALYNAAEGSLPKAMVAVLMRPNTNMWWMLDQDGLIYEVDNNAKATGSTLILDIRNLVLNKGELGMAGFVFSPDFVQSGRFYVYYISNDMYSIIARYKYFVNDVAATSSSGQTIFKFKQPSEIHKGGTMVFTPKDISEPTGRAYYDLYITSGDGGGQNDPFNNAQNLDQPLGKILRMRIPTDYSKTDYTIPDGNIRGEVWAYGFRNPWKCSFDRKDLSLNPPLYCGDVGGWRLEEVNIVRGGGNYGWRNHEGTLQAIGDPITYTPPIFQYCHAGFKKMNTLCDNIPFTGEAITGGYIYRGTKFPQYQGQYIFADYQTGKILRIYNENGVWKPAVINANVGFTIASMAEDSKGEIYFTGRDEVANLYLLQAEDDATTPDPDTNPQNPTADPNCSTGILNFEKTVCCPLNCGACGGMGCDTRPGGAKNCCSSGIIASELSCKENSAPCVMNSTTTTDPSTPTPAPGGCTKGILNADKTVCCPTTCGACGGFGCHERPGGAENCCSSGVQNSGHSCKTYDPPCLVDSSANPTTGDEPDPVDNTTDPTCKNGILNAEKSACCPFSCGGCGGLGCDKFPGGRLSCCSSGIRESGKYCANGTAPCIMK